MKNGVFSNGMDAYDVNLYLVGRGSRGPGGRPPLGLRRITEDMLFNSPLLDALPW